MLIFFLLLLLFFHLNSCIEQSYLIVHQKESLRTFTLYLTQTLIQLKPFLHDSEILVLSEYQKFNHSIVETIFGEDIKNFKLIFESFDYGCMYFLESTYHCYKILVRYGNFLSLNFFCFTLSFSILNLVLSLISVDSEVSIGQKFNYIASYAKGKIFVFLNVNSVLNSASALPKLIYKLKGIIFSSRNSIDSLFLLFFLILQNQV